MARRAASGIKGLSITDEWKGTRDRSRMRFRARVLEPGTTKYTSKRFDTRKEAEAWGDARLAGLKTGLETAEHAHLDVVGAEYCRQLREGDGAERASESYVRHIEQVVAGLVRAGIRDLKAKSFAANVRTWIANLKPNWWAPAGFKFKRTGGKPLSSTLRNRIVREVRALCHHAVTTRRIAYNPAEGIKPFATTRRLKPTFTLAELRTIVSEDARLPGRLREATERLVAEHGGDIAAAAKAAQTTVEAIACRLRSADDEADPWWLPACLMVYTGARAAEAMHLRWQDIDWTAGRIRVRDQDEYDLKNRRERELPLQAELRAILHPLAKPAGFIVEDEHLRTNGSIRHCERRKPTMADYTPAFGRYLRRIGIAPGSGHDKRTAHSLRHGWVAMMLVAGGGEAPRLVAQWAGHGSAVQDQYANAVGRYHAEASAWPRGEFYLRRSLGAPPATAVTAGG